MASFKRQIKAAVKAAGYEVEQFEIGNDAFEFAHEYGIDIHSNEFAVKRGNKAVRAVAEKLIEKGHGVEIRHTGWGGVYANVNAYRHSGHDADYSDTSSVHHY